MPIIFVHGVSVRELEFDALLKRVEEGFAELKVGMPVIGCYWGDLGSALARGGATIPGIEVMQRGHPDNTDLFGPENWQRSIESLLLDDPYLELKALGHVANPVWRGTSFSQTPQEMEQRAAALERIEAEIHDTLLGDTALALLLRQSQQQVLSCIEMCVGDAFTHAKGAIRQLDIVDVAEALIRSMTANLYLCCKKGQSRGALPPTWAGISGRVAAAVTSCLPAAFRGQFYGPLPAPVLAAMTGAAQILRGKIMSEYALVLGDALAYHSNRQPIMQRLQQTIDLARQKDSSGPVWLIGHSLGGVICFEFADQTREDIDGLATVGSQVGLLAELGTLHIGHIPPSMRHQRPTSVRKWVNVYDKNDFLSFLASPMFLGVHDSLFDTQAPFPLSHEQYFHHSRLYEQLVAFFG